jgi:hypothetical protein
MYDLVGDPDTGSWLAEAHASARQIPTSGEHGIEG